VSYALELQADVKKRLRALPFDVQEAFFDLLDDLAVTASPTTLAAQSTEDHVFVFTNEAVVYTLFLRTRTDHTARRLAVASLWYVATV
jgi:hypothetical protein